MKGQVSIFEKSFFDELERKLKDLDVLDFVMKTDNLSFQEAILKLAKYLQMDPKYCDPSSAQVKRKEKELSFIKHVCENFCNSKDLDDETQGCELEIRNGKRSFFLKVDFDPFRVWVDFEGLPKDAFLCALYDGEKILQEKCGANSNSTRYFVDMDWCINDWNGDKEIVAAIKKRKQMIIDDLPRLKEKYAA